MSFSASSGCVVVVAAVLAALIDVLCSVVPGC